MRFLRSRTGWRLCSVYLGVYALSGVYAVCWLLFSRPTPEFNPPSLVALPWTIVLIRFWNAHGIGNAYDRYINSPFLYGGVMWSALLPGALLNAVILYLLGKLFERSSRGE